MSQKDLVTPENPRMIALEQSEKRILDACRRTIEMTQVIAKELARIETGELFTELGYKFFSHYVEERLHMSIRTAQRIKDISATIDQLEKEGLKLPYNDTQTAELLKLEPGRRSIVWRDLLDACETTEKPLTMYAVRTAVELDLEKAREIAAPTGARVAAPPEEGVEIDLNGKPATETPAPERPRRASPRITLSDDGELALEKIRRHCGESVARAIESGNVPLTEKDLIRWADSNEILIRNLAHYVIDLRWTVARAIAFEDRIVDSDTTVSQLIILATARGGSVTIQHNDFQIIINRIA
jgi:hypothetical protein